MQTNRRRQATGGKRGRTGRSGARGVPKWESTGSPIIFLIEGRELVGFHHLVPRQPPLPGGRTWEAGPKHGGFSSLYRNGYFAQPPETELSRHLSTFP